MKRAMIGMVMFAMGVWVLSAQGALVADWQLNDATSGTTPYTAADSSGNGITLTGPNNGTGLTKGMNWTSGQGGGTNGAMHFTDGGHGTTDNAGYLWNTKADLRDIGIGKGGTIIAKVKWAGPGQSEGWVASMIYSSKLWTTRRQSFFIYNDGRIGYCDDYWGTTSTLYSPSGTGVIPGEWTKIQLAWDGPTTTAKIWINDQLVVSSNTFSPVGSTGVEAMAVGGDAFSVANDQSQTNTFNGEIDWVQYYDNYMVPEPMTLGLLAMGGIGLLGRRK